MRDVAIGSSRDQGGEVAIPDRGRRDALRGATGRPDFGTLISPKEKQFVLLDRTTDRAAVLVKDVLWLHGLHSGWSEVIARAKCIIRMVFVGRAVKLVRARLDDYVRGQTAGHALLRVKVVRHHVHRFDGVRGRDIGDIGREPSVSIRSPVNAGTVVVNRKPVDVRGLCSLRIPGRRIAFSQQTNTGNDAVGVLEVPPVRG